MDQKLFDSLSPITSVTKSVLAELAKLFLVQSHPTDIENAQ